MTSQEKTTYNIWVVMKISIRSMINAGHCVFELPHPQSRGAEATQAHFYTDNKTSVLSLPRTNTQKHILRTATICIIHFIHCYWSFLCLLNRLFLLKWTSCKGKVSVKPLLGCNGRRGVESAPLPPLSLLLSLTFSLFLNPFRNHPLSSCLTHTLFISTHTLFISIG